jgi:hypothetical protein
MLLSAFEAVRGTREALQLFDICNLQEQYTLH